MGNALAKSGLEPTLIVLVGLRASQINRCAFCLALHAREAEALGEGLDRLSGLPAWREAPWYTGRERAALEWTEALTLTGPEHPPSDLVARMKEHFSDAELVYLTLAVVTTNAWNRFNNRVRHTAAGRREIEKSVRRSEQIHSLPAILQFRVRGINVTIRGRPLSRGR